MAGSANAGLTLSYCYLADGTKSSALTSTGAGVRYRGNFVYEVTSEGAERLQSVPWAEGRIVLEHYGETVVDSLVLDVPLVPEEDVVAIDTVVAGGFDPRVCWHVTDHLGSTREVVVLGAGLMGRSAVVESNGYLPFGTRYGKTPGTSYILTEGNSNRYRFSGKEEQRFGWDADACRPVADLGLLDFGARYYDPFTCRWTTPDPLAGKYLSLSPYNYCCNYPVGYVDLDGNKPRIYVETKGLGHAFITAGSGENTIVYTYGRYAELDKDKSSSRSTTPVGEGVLIKLTGDEARTYILHEVLDKNAAVYEFENVSDDAVVNYFDAELNTSDKSPSKGKYKDRENARVIDEYNLINNNCVTTTISGIQSGSSADLGLDGIKIPLSLRLCLNYRSNHNNQIKTMSKDEVYEEYKD